MDMKNQKGGHVAKQKGVKANPRKVLQGRVTEVEGGMGYLFQEVKKLNQNIIGLENLVMMYAEFTKKRKDFESFLNNRIEEHEKKLKEKEDDKEKAKD